MATGIQVRRTKGGKRCYRVRLRIKGYPPISKTFERLTDAKLWRVQTEAQIREHRFFGNREASRRTLSEVIDSYMDEVVPGFNHQDRTRRPIQLNWWKKELGPRFLVGITPAAIRASRERLRAGKSPSKRPLSPATCNRYLGTLSAVLTYAQRDLEWIEENPVRRVRRLREPQGRVRFLSEEERERLLEVCRNSPERLLYPAVVVSIATGMRKGELMNLRWPQVNLEQGVIQLEKTKNGHRRSVPLKGHALEVMRDLSRVRRINTNLVFPRFNGLKPKILRPAWERALREAEIEDFRWHDLRHCAGSYAAMLGWSELEIADLLGHRTTRMVRRYSHLSEQHIARRAEEMAESVFGS